MSQTILSDASSQDFDTRPNAGVSQQQQTPNNTNNSSSNNNGDVQQQLQFLRSKKRAENYSRKDKERLIKLVTARLDVIENKVSNTGANLQKAQCWVEIATEYNQGITNTDNWRDDRQLKDLWKRMKFTARSDLIRYARQKDGHRSSSAAARNEDGSNGVPTPSSHGEILDDFTLILLRLVPAHFQMDTDMKVLQAIDELLALSPAEVEEQKVLSRTRRQERRLQMTGHYSNQDDDEDDDDDAVVFLEMNNRLENSPDDNDPVVILGSSNVSLQQQCSNNNNNSINSNTTSTGANQLISTKSDRLDSNNVSQNTASFYTDTTVLTPRSVTSPVMTGGMSSRTQGIDIHTIESDQLQRQQQQPSSQSHMSNLNSSISIQLHQQNPPILQEEPMFTFKSENDAIVDDTARQNWYIEQIGSRNQFDEAAANEVVSDKDYQYRRKRKAPFYRSLLEDDQSEEIRQQLLEMARKQNEKELQLLDVQTQCEKQRLVREKMETENAVLKQRLLLQMLQSQINKGQSVPSLSLLL